MGKYPLTYSCGHAGEVQLFGKLRERENRLAYLERYGKCPACRRAAFEARGPLFWIRQVEGGAEIICWANSYDIREKLTALGFRFSRALRGPEDDNLMQPPRKGWHRIYQRGVAGDQEAEREYQDWLITLEWIQQHNFEHEITLFGARSIIDALAEGRPDLLPGKGE